MMAIADLPVPFGGRRESNEMTDSEKLRTRFGILRMTTNR